MNALITIVARAADSMIARTIDSRRRRAALPVSGIAAGIVVLAWAIVGCVLRRAGDGVQDRRPGRTRERPDPVVEEERYLAAFQAATVWASTSAGRFT